MRTLAFTALLLIAGALGLAGCQRTNEAEFGQQVRAYLLEHPEVLEEAIRKLDQNRAAETAAVQTKAVSQARAALERDERDFVFGNPNGAVTVVEFFDYRCGYCKAVTPEVLDMVKRDGNIRFVLKEFPILPDRDTGTVGVSERAARVALAAKAEGKYIEVHRDLMAERALDDAAIERIIEKHGMDADKIAESAAAPAIDAQLTDTHALAQAVGVNGTPTFIVGGSVIPAADLDALRAAIQKARPKAA
ncbi:MAG: DsbA family protein [Proteobacteria bacterium]|nr:DsbA family protein [Pseudomonadota bacterium]